MSEIGLALEDIQDLKAFDVQVRFRFFRSFPTSC